MLPVTLADAAAFGFFVLAWVGYTFFADKLSRGGKNLMTVMHAFRLRWMKQMMARENRVQDVTALATQMRSVSLFASTTIFILGALVALLGAVDEARNVIKDVPFAVQTVPGVWEAKLLVLLTVFVYAFFKFAWSLRQFNYALTLIGSAPMPGETDKLDINSAAGRLARIATLAVASFNRGVRAYYFALAALCWFIHPYLFLCSTALVIWVLYRREFRSFTLKTLTDPLGDPASRTEQ
ncbi:MAG: DUF599 domain-containing protein [Rhodospirillales bacterium]|nr:DUF599 domain-containing protein [Rhodospirillales bacterium]